MTHHLVPYRLTLILAKISLQMWPWPQDESLASAHTSLMWWYHLELTTLVIPPTADKPNGTHATTSWCHSPFPFPTSSSAWWCLPQLANRMICQQLIGCQCQCGSATSSKPTPVAQYAVDTNWWHCLHIMSYLLVLAAAFHTCDSILYCYTGATHSGLSTWWCHLWCCLPSYESSYPDIQVPQHLWSLIVPHNFGQ